MYIYSTFWLLALVERKLAHMEKEKNVWPKWDSNPHLLEQIDHCCSTNTELQGQMETGCG